VTWIDHAYTVFSSEPYFPVRSPRYPWTIAAGKTLGQHSIRAIEDRGLDRPRCVFIFVYRIGPGVDLGTRNAHKATRHGKPERLIVVPDHPMNRIASQSVLAGQGGDAPVFQPAQPALGSDPNRPVGIEPEPANKPLPESICRGISCSNLAIGEIG